MIKFVISYLQYCLACYKFSKQQNNRYNVPADYIFGSRQTYVFGKQYVFCLQKRPHNPLKLYKLLKQQDFWIKTAKKAKNDPFLKRVNLDQYISYPKRMSVSVRRRTQAYKTCN